jgi:hypothetical protein
MRAGIYARVGRHGIRTWSKKGAEVTKSDIIEKTLREIVPRIEEREELYSVMAELQERLPDTDIRTCGDFRHLNVTCCDTCHAFYPHYEMSLIDLQEWKQNSPEGNLLRRVFGEDADK